MLTGNEVRAAREAAGMTQQQLADAVSVTLRSVGNWERAQRLPAAAERRLRRAYPQWFGAPADPLSTVSDAQLLAEIARRFERARGSGGDERNAASIGTEERPTTSFGGSYGAPEPRGVTESQGLAKEDRKV